MMQGCRCVIDKALEEFMDQIDVEAANPRTQEVDPVLDSRTPGKIDDNARQGFVQGYVGMAVAHDALLVTKRLLEGLAKRNADIFDGVVIVDVQIAVGADFKIEGAVARDLFEHMLEKRNTSGKAGFAGSIKIERDADLRFQRIALHGCTTLLALMTH